MIDSLEFAAGTEAVTANYPQGRLVIVEYTNPQLSTEIDGYGPAAPRGQSSIPVRLPADRKLQRVRIRSRPMPSRQTHCWIRSSTRRLSSGLVKIRTYFRRLERYMVTTSLDIMISTVLWILLGSRQRTS